MDMWVILSPAGDAGHFSLRSAKKTNEKKADPAGGRAIRLSDIGGFVVRPGVPASFCRYRFEPPRTCQFPGFVVEPPVAGITCFKPSVAPVVAGHEVAGAPVPSWARWHRVICPRPSPPRPPHHETIGRRCVVMVRAGNGRLPNGQGFRYRGPYYASRKFAASWPFKPVPADASRTPGRTTKPAPLAPAIALPPAGSAFFSLVFFAERKEK